VTSFIQVIQVLLVWFSLVNNLNITILDAKTNVFFSPLKIIDKLPIAR